MEYKLNKGVGQDVEFCGLKAQYLYLFAGGLLAVFLVFVILYMAGVNRLFCIALCVISASGITLGVFRLNRKYGPHGLMKLAAAGYRPYYIINRKRITSLLNEEICETYSKRPPWKVSSPSCRRGRVHPLQGRGCDRRLQGPPAGGLHPHLR